VRTGGTIGATPRTPRGSEEEPILNPDVSLRPERPMTPYRWLLAAALLSIMLAQMVAMVLVTRSQVLRAEVREAAERSQVQTARAAPPGGTAGIDVSSAGLMKVGLASAR
jgi:hypothetical protein